MQICKLSDDFYCDFPLSKYPELMSKTGRPYLILIAVVEGKTYGIPFRSNCHHRYAYKFHSSNRKTDSFTCLDFSKSVRILKNSYIGEPATIDSEEYRDLLDKEHFVINRFKHFLAFYAKVMKNPEKYPDDYRRLKYSSLNYFE